MNGCLVMASETKCKILETFLRVKTLQNENEVKMILQISVTIVEVRAIYHVIYAEEDSPLT